MDEQQEIEKEAVWRGARLSDDGVYRYHLWRRWDQSGTKNLLTFIMLNPSTADADVDDPTIRRCMGFARSNGYGGIAVSNLYAFRATKPAEMFAAERRGIDIVGPENDEHLRLSFENNWGQIVAAWGAGAPQARVDEVVALAASEDRQLVTIRVTRGGAPGHPLYVPANSTFVPWPPLETPVESGS